MAGFGNFAQNEKKKSKQKNKKFNPGSISTKPVFVMPKMVEKKKRKED